VDPVIVILRVLHIGAGVLWVGAAWTLFLFVSPTLAALGMEAERTFMQHVTRQRRLDRIVFGATIVTVGAGALLYWIDWQRLGATWFQTGFGIGITIGAAAAIAAFLLGPIAILPTVNKLNALGAQIDGGGAPPTPDQQAALQALTTRLRKVFTIDFALLVVAVALMATARYL
jgi:hypothetical protein